MRDEILNQVITLGEDLGPLGAIHNMVAWGVTRGDLDVESPVVQALITGLSKGGVRSKHDAFRRAMRKLGFDYDKNPSAPPENCPTCRGTGKVRRWRRTPTAGMVDEPCVKCKGSGKVPGGVYQVYYKGEELTI